MTINISKKTVSFMLIFALMLSSLSLSVFAVDASKTVNTSRMYYFTVSPSEFANYANSPASYVSPTTYYDDGTYKGTLNLTRAMCWSPIVMGDQLQVRINAEYSGTVYARRTKTVTYDSLYTNIVYPSDFSKYANSPSSYVSPTVYYNDGTYSGTLYLTNAVCWSPIATGNPIGSLLQVRINATYSGTVTER